MMWTMDTAQDTGILKCVTKDLSFPCRCLHQMMWQMDTAQDKAIRYLPKERAAFSMPRCLPDDVGDGRCSSFGHSQS